MQSIIFQSLFKPTFDILSELITKDINSSYILTPDKLYNLFIEACNINQQHNICLEVKNESQDSVIQDIQDNTIKDSINDIQENSINDIDQNNISRSLFNIDNDISSFDINGTFEPLPSSHDIFNMDYYLQSQENTYVYDLVNDKVDKKVDEIKVESTVYDKIEKIVDNNIIEDRVKDNIENIVIDKIEKIVDNNIIEDIVKDNIENIVIDKMEKIVDNNIIEDRVEDKIENIVIDKIEKIVDNNIIEDIVKDNIENIVIDKMEKIVDNNIIEDRVEDKIENIVIDKIEKIVDNNIIEDRVEDKVEKKVEKIVKKKVDKKVDEKVEKRVEEVNKVKLKDNNGDIDNRVKKVIVVTEQVDSKPRRVVPDFIKKANSKTIITKNTEESDDESQYKKGTQCFFKDCETKCMKIRVLSDGFVYCGKHHKIMEKKLEKK